METCPHKMAWGSIRVVCSLLDGHDGEHMGMYYNTNIGWLPGDRRDYVGEFQPCENVRCILPGGHHGNHAS